MVEVAEKILPAVVRRPTKVRRRKGPAGDAGRGIMVNRSLEARIFRRPVLDRRPAVIGARLAFVDLFRDAAHVVDKQAAGFGLHGKGERIA